MWRKIRNIVAETVRTEGKNPLLVERQWKITHFYPKQSYHQLIRPRSSQRAGRVRCEVGPNTRTSRWWVISSTPGMVETDLQRSGGLNVISMCWRRFYRFDGEEQHRGGIGNRRHAITTKPSTLRYCCLVSAISVATCFRKTFQKQVAAVQPADISPASPDEQFIARACRGTEKISTPIFSVEHLSRTLVYEPVALYKTGPGPVKPHWVYPTIQSETGCTIVEKVSLQLPKLPTK